MKISYANALARICERAGRGRRWPSSRSWARTRGSARPSLRAGLGYGGYCFPKDLVAFERLAADLGYDFRCCRRGRKINDDAVDAALDKLRDALWNLEDKRVALLGLAFKPGTDDVRFSPALALARGLLDAGADRGRVRPVRARRTPSRDRPGLQLAEDPYDAARGAHCVVVSTEWQEFRDLDLGKLAELVAFPILVDARNFLDPEEFVAAGFTYYAMGRPAIATPASTRSWIGPSSPGAPASSAATCVGGSAAGWCPRKSHSTH